MRRKQEGCAVFLTTHNMTVAEELCDRVATGVSELMTTKVITSKTVRLLFCYKKNHSITRYGGVKVSLSSDTGRLLETDDLIVGGGLAGCNAAIAAAERGCRVGPPK